MSTPDGRGTTGAAIIEALWQRSRALRTSRQWRWYVPIAITLMSLALILWGLLWGWHDLAQYEWQFNWGSLALASLFYALSLAMSMLGWIAIMRAFAVASTWRQDGKFFLYSLLARRLPTPVPYLASRMFLYEGIGVPKRITSVGMLWEHIFLIASSALLFLLMLPLTPLLGTQTRMLPALLTAAVILPFILRPALLTNSVNWLLRRWGKEPLAMALPPHRVGSTLLLYALAWLTGALIVFFTTRAVYPLEWAALPMVVQCWSLSGLVAYIILFLPFNSGLRDLTLAALLALIIPLPAAVTVVVLLRLWVMLNELVWAFVMYRL